MRLLFLFIILIYAGLNYAQETNVEKNSDEEKEYFSEQIALVRNDYLKKAKRAMWKGHNERAEKLYKKMISEELIGTYMDNFYVSCLNTNNCCINDYSKPIILITYASWCVPGKGEIPAINELAERHKNNIDFIVLFWDDKKSARKATKNLNNDIHFVYVDELKQRYTYTIKMLKHSLGFPKVFSIGSDKKILQIKNTKGLPFYKDLEEAVETNKAFFNTLISDIISYEDQVIDSVETAE